MTEIINMMSRLSPISAEAISLRTELHGSLIDSECQFPRGWPHPISRAVTSIFSIPLYIRFERRTICPPASPGCATVCCWLHLGPIVTLDYWLDSHAISYCVSCAVYCIHTECIGCQRSVQPVSWLSFDCCSYTATGQCQISLLRVQ